MKKALSLFLALAMFLTLSTAALAEPFYLEAAGVTIEVPEGMTAEDVSKDEVYSLLMKVTGRDDLVYAYTLAYVEELADKYLENMTEEEATEFGKGLAQAIVNPQIASVVYEEILYLVVADEKGTQVQYITLNNGWISSVAVATTGAELVEAEILLCAQLLSTITYDEAAAS